MESSFDLILRHASHRRVVHRIYYALFSSFLYGRLFVAWTEEGVCYSTFAQEGIDRGLDELKIMFPNATLEVCSSGQWFDTIVQWIEGVQEVDTIPLIIYGTELQNAVWQALLSIPRGSTRSYSEVAILAGYPRAVRAVASAVGRNPIVPFIPCHRVLPRLGGVGEYSAEGGAARKMELLAAEQSSPTS